MKQGPRRAAPWQTPAQRRSDADRLTSPDAAALLHLQRTAGNRAVTAALQGTGLFGFPLPVQRGGKEKQRKKAKEKLKKAKQPAKLKKPEEAGQTTATSVVPPPSVAPKVSVVKNPEDSRKRYGKLKGTFDASVAKWRSKYTLSLQSGTIVKGVKEDLVKIREIRSQLDQYTGYVSKMVVDATAVIKTDEQGEEADRKDDWVAFEKECLSAGLDLDQTLDELKEMMKPALKVERGKDRVIELRADWATHKTSVDHKKHMTDTRLSELEYYEAAKKLAIDKIPSGTHQVLSSRSRQSSEKTVFFDPGNGLFAVVCPEGILSMFKPRHGQGYYNRQVA